MESQDREYKLVRLLPKKECVQRKFLYLLFDFLSPKMKLHNRQCHIQGQSLHWNDFNNEVGPWVVKTDYGICCFVSPYLNMKPINWTLGDIKIFHELNAIAKNGESNGLDIILDAEQFNYAFYHENTDSNGGGFKLTLHDHRDKPMIQFSSQLIHTGTETQINVKPTITYTTG